VYLERPLADFDKTSNTVHVLHITKFKLNELLFSYGALYLKA
jgi:hypothetical protein